MSVHVHLLGTWNSQQAHPDSLGFWAQLGMYKYSFLRVRCVL